VLRVLQHVEECEACATEVASMRDLGDMLRDTAHEQHRELPAAMAGLASTVISRTKAEAAQSWRSVLRRGSEDWHWFLVGAGSVAATFFCTVFVSALLAFGPDPARDDSLAALIRNLNAPTGMLFLYATPDGAGEASLFPADPDGPAASKLVAALGGDTSEAELVTSLAELMMPRDRFVPLSTMTPHERQQAELLSQQIKRIRMTESVRPIALEALFVHQVRFVTSTNVIAKGL
jgi:hypothetical protein